MSSETTELERLRILAAEVKETVDVACRACARCQELTAVQKATGDSCDTCPRPWIAGLILALRRHAS